MINEELVKKVAKIARLNLKKEELKEFTEDFTNVLKAFSDLDNVKSTSISSFHPVKIEETIREDIPEERNKSLDYIKGPKTI